MAIVRVILESMAGKKFKVQLPDDVPVNRMLPQLISKLNLSLTNAVGRRISYRLLHVESGEQLRDNDTLSQAQVQNDHTIRLIADLVAGQHRAVINFFLDGSGDSVYTQDGE